MANDRRAGRATGVVVLGLLSQLLLVPSSPHAELRPAGSPAPQQSDAQIVAFDLPPGPLSVALERFMSATNTLVVVDSELTAGRRSAALKGAFVAEAALRTLLVGTGLNVEAIGPGAFTLRLPAPGTRPLPASLHYAGAIQAAVTSALCQQTDTRVMQYRLVLRLWLDPAGAVTHVELASSTGDSKLDMAIAAALKHADVGEAPPAGLPQPVKLAILPATSDSACADADESRGRATPQR